jgi:hypothetical protein
MRKIFFRITVIFAVFFAAGSAAAAIIPEGEIAGFQKSDGEVFYGASGSDIRD